MKTKPDAGLSRSYILDGLTSMMSGFFIYRADFSAELLFVNDAVLDIYDIIHLMPIFTGVSIYGKSKNEL